MREETPVQEKTHKNMNTSLKIFMKNYRGKLLYTYIYIYVVYSFTVVVTEPFCRGNLKLKMLIFIV